MAFWLFGEEMLVFTGFKKNSSPNQFKSTVNFTWKTERSHWSLNDSCDICFSREMYRRIHWLGNYLSLEWGMVAEVSSIYGAYLPKGRTQFDGLLDTKEVENSLNSLLDQKHRWVSTSKQGSVSPLVFWEQTGKCSRPTPLICGRQLKSSTGREGSVMVCRS